MKLIYIYRDENNTTSDPVLVKDIKVRFLQSDESTCDEKNEFLKFRDSDYFEPIAYISMCSGSWRDLRDYCFVLNKIMTAVNADVGVSFCRECVDDCAVTDEDGEYRGFTSRIMANGDAVMNVDDREGTGYTYTKEFYNIVDKFLNLFDIDYYYHDKWHTKITILEKGFQEV